MNDPQVAKLISFCAGVFSLLVAMTMMRKAVVRAARQEIFSLRSELFVAAAQRKAFDDPHYQQTRLMLNGALRHIESFSGFYWLYVWTMVMAGRCRPIAVASFADSPVAAEIQSVRCRLNKMLRRHMWLVGLDGLIAMLVVEAFGSFARLARALSEEFQNIGRDDMYARSLRGRGPWCVAG